MMGSGFGDHAPTNKPSSAAFDPIIEMVKAASAPFAREEVAEMEDKANSPMDTGVKSEPFVADDAPTFKIPSQVIPDSVPCTCFCLVSYL